MFVSNLDKCSVIDGFLSAGRFGKENHLPVLSCFFHFSSSCLFLQWIVFSKAGYDPAGIAVWTWNGILSVCVHRQTFQDNTSIYGGIEKA